MDLEHQGMSPVTTSEMHRFECPIKHGVWIEVRADPVVVGVSDIAEGLAEMLRHFKQQRDVRRVETYPQSFYFLSIVDGKKTLGGIQLTSRDITRLATDLWVDVISAAYATASTVEQMSEKPEVWNDAAAQDGGALNEVLCLLQESNGQLRAVEEMFRRKRGG